MVSMDTGIRHDLMGARGVDLLSRNINNIVGNLWQRQETEHTTTNTSNSSNGNMSPGSGESCPESPHGKSDDRRMGDEDGGRTSSNGGADHSGIMDDSGRPSIGIRSDLLPQLSKDGGFGDITGLPALEALRRQAGYQNPFLSGMGSPLTPSGGMGLQLTSKRPSQPPTPQSSTSGGDPSSAWSFEEQFKQLYEIDENPKRKEFLDELFSFMQKRGTPINRLPIMAKQVLDLYELYNLVVGRGGLVEVINKKQWQEIIKGLGLPSSITSAAFTLRTQYTKYLYPLEASQFNFSNTGDLQNAIDGNKREGRRLGPYEMGGGFGRLPHSPTQSPPHPPHHPGLSGPMGDPLAQLEMTRLALWKLYSQGQTPPPPPHLLGLPNPAALDLDSLRRKEQERLMEEHKEQMQMRAEDERRREEARRRITDDSLTMEPADKRLRRADDSHHTIEDPEVGVVDDEEEEMEEPEIELTRKKVSAAPHLPANNTTTISLNSSGDTEDGGKSMKISLEVNGIIYTGVLYAKPS